MSALYKIAISLMFTGILFGINSCAKDDQTCTAVITVVKTTGAPLSGAAVKLTSLQAISKGDLAAYLPANAITDGSGSATFTFKQPAILDIEVTHAAYPGKKATDLIKLEPGESVQKVITMIP